MGKKILYGFLIMAALAVSATPTYFIFKRAGILQSKTEQELQACKAALGKYVQREEKIRDVSSTLIASYGLDSIHAHYYALIFVDCEQKYGVPWDVVAAIMRMESNFVSSAKSPMMCKGLMQLKESTMQAMCVKLGIRYKNDITIWDDVANIFCGMLYLSEAAKEKGMEDAIKVYVGGMDYARTMKVRREVFVYVGEYNSSVSRERERLKLAYQGIRAMRDRKGKE